MSKASFFKPFLDFSEQAQLLIDRGLDVRTEQDRKILLNTLKSLNFFRFNGYCMRYYEDNHSHRFTEEASFRRIWNDYLGDMRLRSVLFEAIQEVEICLRAQLVNVLASRHGIFPYKAEYYDCSDTSWNEMYEKHILRAVRISKEQDILDFLAKYREPVPPIWMTIEVLSFGELSTLYTHYLNSSDKKLLAERYALPAVVLSSWFHSLSALRNRCAHHAKLIDSKNSIGIRIPKYPENQRYKRLFDNADKYSLYANIIAICYLTGSMGQESKAAIMLERLMRAMKEYGIEDSRLGFPKGISITDL